MGMIKSRMSTLQVEAMQRAMAYLIYDGTNEAIQVKIALQVALDAVLTERQTPLPSVYANRNHLNNSEHFDVYLVPTRTTDALYDVPLYLAPLLADGSERAR
jgi:hypothetical protein